MLSQGTNENILTLSDPGDWQYRSRNPPQSTFLLASACPVPWKRREDQPPASASLFGPYVHVRDGRVLLAWVEALSQ